MQWTKPDFQEITLNMEVSAYVNTEDVLGKTGEPARRESKTHPAEQADSD